MRFSLLLLGVVVVALIGAGLMIAGALLTSVKAVLAGLLFASVAVALAVGEVWWLGRPRR